MKKVFLFLLVTCSVALTSCSDDDNAEAIEEATDTNGNSIIGLWVMTSTDIGESITTTKRQEFNFKVDKTGSYSSTETGEEDVNISLTWTKSGDEYTMSGGGDSKIITIADSDGTMALLDNDGDVMALKE